MQDVFELEKTSSINSKDSYIISYPYMIAFFASKEVIRAEDLVCGAHMVYGWMPTILELYTDKGNLNLGQAAELLSSVNKGGGISDGDMTNLSKLINNSLVGASKLLHFISPDIFPIWDSKVFMFVFNTRPHNYRVNKIENYRKYIEVLSRLREDPRFESLHNSMNQKIGYEVSPLRALELVMYLNAPSAT
jgi:hypothetical protein